MNNNQLTTINQNAKSALIKSKHLLDLTKKILDKKELIQTFPFKPFIIEKGHTSSIYAIAISPDGKYIVSGSDDDTIKIWDFKTFEYIYTIDKSYQISIDKHGYFTGSDEAIDKYLRVSEEPLTQRKLTSEEIKHFRKKGDFLEIEENIEKLKKYHEMFEIDIDDDEIPF